DRLDDDVLAAQRSGPRDAVLGARAGDGFAVAGLDVRKPRYVALHERLAREQQLDVHLEEPQLERSDVLAAHDDAIAIDCDLERRRARGELGLLLIAAAWIAALGRGAIELVEHRGERGELEPPAVDRMVAPALRELARTAELAGQARGIRGEVVVLQAI